MMLRATLPLLPQGFREQLVQMSHEEFSNNTSSLAATYREPPKTLGEAAGRIWGEVGCGGPADGAGPRQHMHGNDMLCFPSLHLPPSDRCTGHGAVCVCVCVCFAAGGRQIILLLLAQPTSSCCSGSRCIGASIEMNHHCRPQLFSSGYYWWPSRRPRAAFAAVVLTTQPSPSAIDFAGSNNGPSPALV